MKEFTFIIKVQPVGSTVNTVFEFMADHFDFNPTVTDEEGGPAWNCDKTFVIDKPSENASQFFRVPRNAIVTLTTSDRTSCDIGTNEIPARVQVVRFLQKAQLIVNCTMLFNPLC